MLDPYASWAPSSVASRLPTLREIGVVGLVRGGGVGRHLTLGIWVEREPGRVEQPRVVGRERFGPGGRRRAASQRRGRSPQRMQRLVHAVQRANEAQRHHPGEVARKPAGRLPARSHLADQDLVLPMAGLLERRPGRVEQLPVVDRRDLHGRVVDRLRGELLAVVGLIPDRPEPHGRQRGLTGRLVRAVVPGADGLGEHAELLGRGLPGAHESGRGAGGDPRCGRPQRGGRLEREVDAHPAGRGGS